MSIKLTASLKNGGRSLMITGASSSGKSTIVKALVDDYGLTRLPGDTTRAPRAGELDGFDYNYLKDQYQFWDNFEEGLYIDPNLRVTEYNGYNYGSPRYWITEPIFGDFPVIFTPTSTITANMVREACGDRLFWVHLVADENSRSVRLLARAITEEELRYRLSNGDSHGLKKVADMNIDTSQNSVDYICQIIVKNLLKES